MIYPTCSSSTLKTLTNDLRLINLASEQYQSAHYDREIQLWLEALMQKLALTDEAQALSLL